MGRSRKGLFLVFGMVLLLGLSSCPLRGGERVRSNLELAKDLTSEVVEELLGGFPKKLLEREISLKPYADDEKHQFITNIFTSVLASKGYNVYSPSESKGKSSGNSSPVTQAASLRLEYQALVFDLRYPKIFRLYLFGGKRVKRRADVKLFAKLMDPKDDRVVWVGEASRSCEDQFPFSLLSQVEKDLFDFTKPPHVSTKWGRVIEPVVVSGIIVGLIYLFFSNQSGS